MKIEVIYSLDDAKSKRCLFDKICLVQSWGEEHAFWNHDSLGLGNLLTAYIGSLIIDENIEIISFNDIRIASWKWLIRKPYYWYNRSAFKVRNFSNSFKRMKLKPEITATTYINIKDRVLYLSTDLVNRDEKYLEKYTQINKSKIKHSLYKYYGIKIDNINNDKSFDGKNRKLGIHIRLGDFVDNNKTHEGYAANQRLPLENYLNAIKILLGERNFSEINIFSDEQLKKNDEIKFKGEIKCINAFICINFKYGTNAIKTINEMIECDTLLIANSTFSLWAAILGGRECYYLLNELPYHAERYIENLINLKCIKSVN